MYWLIRGSGKLHCQALAAKIGTPILQSGVLGPGNAPDTVLRTIQTPGVVSISGRPGRGSAALGRAARDRAGDHQPRGAFPRSGQPQRERIDPRKPVKCHTESLMSCIVQGFVGRQSHSRAAQVSRGSSCASRA